jgi:hypothetical protein
MTTTVPTITELDRDLTDLQQRRAAARVNREIDLITVLTVELNRLLTLRHKLSQSSDESGAS